MKHSSLRSIFPGFSPGIEAKSSGFRLSKISCGKILIPFILLLSLNGRLSAQCMCSDPGLISEKSYNSYSAIFEGVVKSRTVLAEFPEKDFVEIEFEIEKLYKGTAGSRTMKVRSPNGGAICDIGAVQGDKWLIFTFSTTNGEYSNLCLHNMRISPSGWNHYPEARLQPTMDFLNQKGLLALPPVEASQPQVINQPAPEVQIPAALRSIYTSFVQSFAGVDKASIPDKVRPFLLENSVAISTAPLDDSNYSQEIRVDFLVSGFQSQLVSATKNSDGTILLRTPSSGLYYVETRDRGWRIYRYFDKPVE